MNGVVKTPDAQARISYTSPKTLYVGGTCEVDNGNPIDGDDIQFYCTWKLHQAPTTLKMEWDPVLEPLTTDEKDGSATSANATGTWVSVIKIEYQSGTNRILLKSKTATFVDDAGQGGGGTSTGTQ